MHAHDNEAKDPFTLHVAASVAPMKHKCSEACTRFPAWYMQQYT
jgi:hypothetical protein